MARHSPPDVPRSNRPINYSKFDHIGSSDEEDVEAEVIRSQPPSDIREDLEDYFRRLDERRSEHSDGTSDVSPASSASVERFSEDQIARLKSYEHSASSPQTECAICLTDFEVGETLTALPCAAAHAFHTECVRGALSRSIYCPLCRVDVRALIMTNTNAETTASGSMPPVSPRQLGFTRDGGIIQRYEPNPPAELARPSYIPSHQAHQAELVEILYPNHGFARVWRLPRALYEQSEGSEAN